VEYAIYDVELVRLRSSDGKNLNKTGVLWATKPWLDLMQFPAKDRIMSLFSADDDGSHVKQPNGAAASALRQFSAAENERTKNRSYVRIF
jgi:hypothetical protein